MHTFGIFPFIFSFVSVLPSSNNFHPNRCWIVSHPRRSIRKKRHCIAILSSSPTRTSQPYLAGQIKLTRRSLITRNPLQNLYRYLHLHGNLFHIIYIVINYVRFDDLLAFSEWLNSFYDLCYISCTYIFFCFGTLNQCDLDICFVYYLRWNRRGRWRFDAAVCKKRSKNQMPKLIRIERIEIFNTK